ncbi:alpha/beta hydrolase [Frigidibacter sp. RF13]|uniref:alpha/beta fold hydrolase n=1 Tax=Frigidibacter sp. RF13 TaxID=2997340 RepID=UPI00226EF2E2|nr:alpha/beta hydrolase [Frigidibacter sp. RF13]MCY1126141.1 alpha/beta hydrolase [Frigidibacter sp. RF13]
MKIVVLPGLDGTGRLVQSFADYLRADHAVEIFSYPVDLASYAEIDEWLAPRLPEGPYLIVAESFSGPLAIKIAARRPAGLRAVAFVATFARAPVRFPPRLIRTLNLIPGSLRVLSKVGQTFTFGLKRSCDDVASYQAALRQVPPGTLVERLCATASVDVRRELSRIAAPCAYLRAAQDRLVHRSVSEDFLPYCERVIAVDAPHFLLLTRPKEAAGHVSDFLNAVA